MAVSIIIGFSPRGLFGTCWKWLAVLTSVLIKLKATNQTGAFLIEPLAVKRGFNQKIFVEQWHSLWAWCISYNNAVWSCRQKLKRNFVWYRKRTKRLYYFQEKCNVCHTEPPFSDFKLRNNGLSVSPNIGIVAPVLRICHRTFYGWNNQTSGIFDLTGTIWHDGRISSLRGVSGSLLRRHPSIKLIWPKIKMVLVLRWGRCYFILFLKLLPTYRLHMTKVYGSQIQPIDY